MASPKPTTSNLRHAHVPAPTSTPQRQLLCRAANAAAETAQLRAEGARGSAVNDAAFPPVTSSSRGLPEVPHAPATRTQMSAIAAAPPSGMDSEPAKQWMPELHVTHSWHGDTLQACTLPTRCRESVRFVRLGGAWACIKYLLPTRGKGSSVQTSLS
jgi:hypothetical protein